MKKETHTWALNTLVSSVKFHVVVQTSCECWKRQSEHSTIKIEYNTIPCPMSACDSGFAANGSSTTMHDGPATASKAAVRRVFLWHAFEIEQKQIT
jgi:hypothetical protein